MQDFEKSISLNRHYIFALILGFIGILMQVAIFRELSVFLGSNELLLALFLFIWLMAAGLGSLAFTKSRSSMGIVIFIAISAMMIPFLRLTAVSFLPQAGMIMPVPKIIILCLFAILPIAFADGAAFASISKIARKPRRIYALEGIGAFLGGLASLFTIGRIDIAIFSASVALIALVITALILDKKFLIAIPVILIVHLPFNRDLHHSDLFRMHYNRSTIIENKESRQGRLFITELSEETYLYCNNTLIGTKSDSLNAATWLHAFMLANSDKKTVLVNGGALSGINDELMKYDKMNLTYFETDPVYLDFVITNFQSRFEGVELASGNIRKAIKEKDYQAIIYSPSIPDDLASNSFYSFETLSTIKNSLTSDGICCIYLSLGENFLTDREKELTGSIWHTVDSIFSYSDIFYLDGIAMILGYNENPYCSHFERFTNAQSPPGLYIPADIIGMQFNKLRQQAFTNQIGNISSYPINYDLKPVSYFYGFSQFASLSGIEIPDIIGEGNKLFIFIVLIFIAILLLIARFAFAGSFNLYRIAFLGGIFGLGVQLLWILIFQIALGNVYWAFGLLSGLFLLGSSIAAWFGTEKIKTWQVLIFMVLICFIGSLLLSIELIYPIIAIIMIILSGIAVGVLYCTLLRKPIFFRSPGLLYSMDLLGASLSAFLPALILAPLFGIPITLGIIGIILIFGMF